MRLYGAVEVGANARNTLLAKGRSLGGFMAFFAAATHSDHPDQWTRSVTAAYLRHLEDAEGRKPTTVNRALVGRCN